MGSGIVLNVDDWERIPEDGNRYELIEGELWVSRPFDSFSHQRIIHHLVVGIASYLKGNPVGFVVPGPGIIFDDFNAVIPDVAFVSNKRQTRIVVDDLLRGGPDVVMEVLSPGVTNEDRDRKAKRKLYAKFGVDEYWIADPVKQSIEVHALLDGVLELVATFSGDDQITSSVLPRLELKTTEVFKF